MANYGVELYGNAIIVNVRFAEEHPDAVKGFLRAFTKSLKETVRQPTSAVGSVLKRNITANKNVELERLTVAIRDNIVSPEVKEAATEKSTKPVSPARSNKSHSHTNSRRQNRNSTTFSIRRSCRLRRRASTNRSALFNTLENADVIGHRGAAHIEHAAKKGVFYLKVPGNAHELHGAKRVHRNAGRANWMTFCLQATGRVHRQLAVFLGPPFHDGASTLAFGCQPHRLVFDKLGNGEAVVGLHERQIAKLKSRFCQSLLPGVRAPFKFQDVSLRHG